MKQITAEEEINKAAEKYTTGIYRYRSPYETFFLAVKWAMEEYRSLPPVDGMRWVKASKRLPSTQVKNGQKLSIKYKGVYDLLQMHRGRWCWYDQKDIYEVDKSAWPVIEWLEEGVPPVDVRAVEMEAKKKLIWEMIEDWQMSRESDTNINEPLFSYQDIEIDLYEWLEKVNSSATLPPSPENKK